MLHQHHCAIQQTATTTSVHTIPILILFHTIPTTARIHLWLGVNPVPRILPTHRIGIFRARLSSTNTLLVWRRARDSEGRRAAISEIRHQHAADGHGVLVGHTEREGGETDLGDEVADFVGVEGHESEAGQFV